MTNQYQTNHPKLPMIMYFLDKRPGWGHLRVAGENNIPVPIRQIRNAFKRLLRATNYLHQEVHTRLDIRTESWDSRRTAFYNWLIALLLHQPNLLPVIGSISLAHTHLAPWEDHSYHHSLPLFTPPQLTLIHFLSKKNSVRRLKSYAARFVTAWYQLHRPHEYHHLDFKS
jgi:hypothetical protein